MNLYKSDMKVTKELINTFLEPRKMAIAGVSRNEKKFGYQVFKELLDKGYDVVPINPRAEAIHNIPCKASVSELTDDIESLLILTPKKQTDEVLKQAIQKGIKNIWVQQSSETEETLKIAEEYQKDIIFNKCIYMFAEPKGFHKFHRTIVKLFGGLPK